MKNGLWNVDITGDFSMKRSVLILLLAVSILVFVAPVVAQTTFDCPGNTFVGDSGEQVINPSAGSAACFVETTGGTVTLTGTLDPAASIGSSETLTASESGSFLSLYDSAGRTIDLGTLPGSLASVTDPNGNQTSYTYDSTGRVTSETESGMTVTYAYDSAGRVTSATNASGMTRFTYDSSSGNIATETDPSGHLTTFTYDTTSGRVLSETTPSGTISYTYDSRGDLVQETGPSGTTSFTYDTTSGRVLSETTPSGTTSYTYDSRGDLVQETGPSGTTSFTYDTTSGRVLSETTPSGTTSYTYDSRGDLIQETGPSGTTSFTYDGLGRVIDVVDPITPNGTTSFAYTPEPASMVLFGTGLLGIALVMRKRLFA